MGSGAVLYVPSFTKIGSGIRKLGGGGVHNHTHTETLSHKPNLFVQNKESSVFLIFHLMNTRIVTNYRVQLDPKITASLS
jgi:hypothetical protein